MDENVPRAISIGVRLRGVDVLTAHEDKHDSMLDNVIFTVP